MTIPLPPSRKVWPYVTLEEIERNHKRMVETYYGIEEWGCSEEQQDKYTLYTHNAYLFRCHATIKHLQGKLIDAESRVAELEERIIREHFGDEGEFMPLPEMIQKWRDKENDNEARN